MRNRTGVVAEYSQRFSNMRDERIRRRCQQQQQKVGTDAVAAEIDEEVASQVGGPK
jgi:hypothetical protein